MRNIPSIWSRVATALMMLLALAAVPAIARALDVEVWTDKGDDAVYKTGDAMRIKVRPSADAHLLVYEIDALGAVNLLFPIERGPSFVEGGTTLRLPIEESGLQLIVGSETGQGFIVAVASDRPFRDLPWFLRPFDPQAASVGYDGAPQDSAMSEEGFDERGHVLGDPYVAMERIRRRIVSSPENVDGIASDYTTYYVHEVVRYPRYLCNDCHRPGYWAWWSGFDPYYASCSVFDFRVNWRWYWGPTLWTGYVPYYYYVVRTDCPPYYTPWYGSQYRFTSWDGWNRWTDLWGGQLRRYKPGVAPVSYTPPPPRGMIWRKGETPPGFVPGDVRTRAGSPGGGMRDVLTKQRDSGRGGPTWRGKPGSTSAPGSRPGVSPGGRAKPADGGSGGEGEVAKRRAGGQRPQGGGSTETKDSGERRRGWWRPPAEQPSGGGGDKAKDPPRTQPKERPRDESKPPPSNPPPKRDDGGSKPPPSTPPPRNDGGYKPPPPPSTPQPRWNPPTSRPPAPPAGRGGGSKGGGSG